MAFIGKQPSKAALTSSDITDGVVTADKLASDSVTTAKIADNGVTTAKINADAVTDAKIADDVVGSEHLTAGEVDTTALGADAVTGAKIADDAINSEHYTDGSIDTAHIADLNVTSGKIAADAITAAKIADDAISDEHLDPTAITGQTAETSIADDDLILISDTSASAALKKMTKANFVSGVGGGKINQVVTNYDTTERRTNSSSFQAATGIDLNITPSATNSKVLITFGLTLRSSSSNSIYSIRRTISGTTAALTTEGDYQGYSRLEDSDKSYPCFLEYLDSPNTTSQVTYQIYFKNNSGGYAYINEHGSSYSHIRAMEVLA
jgi:hypothetical protein